MLLFCSVTKCSQSMASALIMGLLNDLDFPLRSSSSDPFLMSNFFCIPSIFSFSLLFSIDDCSMSASIRDFFLERIAHSSKIQRIRHLRKNKRLYNTKGDLIAIKYLLQTIHLSSPSGCCLITCSTAEPVSFSVDVVFVKFPKLKDIRSIQC